MHFQELLEAEIYFSCALYTGIENSLTKPLVIMVALGYTIDRKECIVVLLG